MRNEKCAIRSAQGAFRVSHFDRGLSTIARVSKFYLTTPIYYANDVPHLGHAYTTILADTIARQRRLAGDDVHFLTGTDEHGDKIEEAAKKQGTTPQALVDRVAEKFRETWRDLAITNTDFIRTTEDRHKRAVQDVLTRLQKEGHFYKAAYEGWFCTPCERFWTEKEIAAGNCPNPECRRPLQKLVEENHFFRMSRHQAWLREHIQKHPEFIQPEIRRNEVLGFLSKPLGDLCISRPRSRVSWGIPLPFDPDYVTYVWFDALLNYITAIGYPFEMRRFQRWWPADLHVIGKEIVTTHCVYWPTMLAALDLPLPKTILAHGWWLVEGEKMSKSKGNVIDPGEMSRRHGLDLFRFYLLREMSPGQDASFAQERFKTIVNTDLANNVGNLFSRALTMIEKYWDAKVPARPAEPSPFARGIAEDLLPKLPGLLRKDRPDETIALLLAHGERANRFIEERKPWELAKKGDAATLSATLYELAEFLRILSAAAEPYLPKTVLLMREAFAAGSVPADPFRWGLLEPGQPLRKGAVLFPRMES